jgi:hypothetical protein
VKHFRHRNQEPDDECAEKHGVSGFTKDYASCRAGISCSSVAWSDTGKLERLQLFPAFVIHPGPAGD